MFSNALKTDANGDLSLGGKPLATREYVDDLVDTIDVSTSIFTAPIRQILKSNNQTNKGNIAFGNGALSNYLSNDTGEYNTAIGNNTLRDNTSGWKNTALGDETLIQNTTGSYNTGLGKNAFYGNTTQSNNTGVGHQAAMAGAGDNNTIVGASSCENNTIGSHNSTLGTYALRRGCGDLNTAIGYNAGINSRSNNSNNNNTFLGALSDLTNDTSTFSNSTAVGYKSKITASNQIVLGTSTETVRIPKFTTAGVVRSDASGNLSSTGLIGDADITNASITNAKLASDIDKSKVGLGKVDNTSDAEKPISTLTQTALMTINNKLILSYPKILNTDQSIYADGAQGSVISGTPYGWGFSNPNNNASKINWYYFSKERSGKSIKVNQLSNMYCVITQLSNTEMENPFFVLYTTLGSTSTDNATNWYRTKLFYGSNALPENVDKSKPILLYTGTDDTSIHPEILSSNRQRLQLNSSLCIPTTITDSYVSSSTDEINLISLQTSSQTGSYNKYNFSTSELGLKSSVYSETNICVTNNNVFGISAMVGLGNVDNTSDADKPISTLTQTALDLKANKTELNVMPTTEPQSPVTGAFWVDINNQLLKVHIGSGNWLSFSPVT